MFGINLKPENILELLPRFGIDPATILPQIERMLIDEAAKIAEETGRRVFLVANTVNGGQNIQVNIYTEGERAGDLDPYKSVPFGEILNLFKNFENSVKNDIAPQSAAGNNHSAAAGSTEDRGRIPAAGETGASGTSAEFTDK